jgi:hypothetical protein
MKPAIGTLFALSLCVFRKEKGLLAIVIFSFGLLCPQGREQNGKVPPTGTSVTATTEHAVIQAIEDEIYDWGCQNSVDLVAHEISRDKYQLPVYINPNIYNGRGEVIYKFMPIGELYRSFFPEADGLIQLDNDPGIGFGPERPSYNTLFMDDDELCRFKHDWLKLFFIIEGHPGRERIAEARMRQKSRLGDSYYPHSKPCDL